MGEIIGVQLGFISMMLISVGLVERIAWLESEIQRNQQRVALLRNAIRLAECGVFIRVPAIP